MFGLDLFEKMDSILKKELALRFKQFVGSEFESQQQAADLLTGGQQAIISKMCNGKYNIGNNVILALHYRKLLNINWYYTGKGAMKVKTIEPASPTEDVKRLILLHESLEKRVEFIYKALMDIQEAIATSKHN